MSGQTVETKIRPLGNRVLAKCLEAEEKKGGILLPDTAKKKQEKAVILEVGPGKRDKQGNLIAMPVKKGDKVLMDKYAGTEINLNGEDYTILSADDIIAIVED